MPNIKYTEVITKIILRNDILSNWEVSSLVLEKGEPAVELNPNTGMAKIKFGDGTHTFADLPYSTVTPDEVREMINSSNQGGSGGGSGGGENFGGTVSGISSVTLSSGTKNGTLKLTVDGVDYDNIPVAGLGTAAYTDSSAYATASQGQRADISMVGCGSVSELPSWNLAKGNTYNVTADFTIPANLTETGDVLQVFIGNTISINKDGKWYIVSGVANSLSRGISASVSGAVTGSASAANAGETLDINITSINTDYLTQGQNILIFNGGSAKS